MAAFAERVTRRFKLDPVEMELLEKLEAKPVVVRRGQTIVEEGDQAGRAFVLISGWVASCTRFPDGSSQVRRLHFPGDLLAMPSVMLRHHAEDLEATSDAVIAPFSRAMLAELFHMPRLAAILYMFAQSERVTAGDRLASLGHDGAKARMAFLLVDILHRLRSADAGITDAFQMELTREQIAHVIGVTAVHASRTWSALLAERLIRCEGRRVTVLDEARLIDLSQYREREDELDLMGLHEFEAERMAA